ncbi:Tannase [Fulvia fulva]|uniref:Carboxylic ester hydrolase n=1 Tax=Passalora fulva TaxID=5499 RepID=A0A9Q8PHI7_PASFU|nr:Tannase [Fulvia fulva]KAK4626950.1 Tannase [Fulvia fulva]KAK4627938.1 Tannase [Fulvia fulva]UJO22517.1 Tannase [Fulvia fulva]WPV13931.1 Tannase [Fulvia fulva]WPV28594.1 Tannase [Fulvia fulva]
MKRTFVSVAGATAASAPSLSSICSSSNVKSALPCITGINYGDVTAAGVYNASVEAGDDYPATSGRNYCNVTVNYSHGGKSDSVNVCYYLPEPSQYEGRFLATGGGGFAINSGASGLDGGLVYGAAAGCTDGGMGWGRELEEVMLTVNGSINYDMPNNLGYLSVHEMTEIGKGLSKNFYNSSKLYAYYQGCSEGGCDGWSQPHHDWPQIFETADLNGYAPNSCALAKIVNETIAACDALDGKTDGVVARSDLCHLHYNATAAIGKAYSCAASTSINLITGAVSGSSPAANGTVTAHDVAVFLAVQNGPYDSNNRHLYVGFQPGTDAAPNAAGTYNTAPGSYDVAAISGIGAEWIQYLLNKVEDESLSLKGVGVDALRWTRSPSPWDMSTTTILASPRKNFKICTAAATDRVSPPSTRMFLSSGISCVPRAVITLIPL